MRYFDGEAWSSQAQWARGPALQPPRPPLRHLRPPAFAVAFGLLFVIVVGGRLLDGVLGRFAHSLLGAQIVTWIFYVVVYGSMAVMVLGVVRRFGSGSLRDDVGLWFRLSDAGWGVLLFVGTRIAQVAVTAPLITIPALRHSTQRYSDVMRHQPTSLLITLVVVGVVVAPVVEELVFRGVLLRGLMAHVPAPAAAVIQGVIFGLYHFAPELGLYNIVLITANSTFGVIFGFVALRRRALGTGIVAHALTNASALAVVFATR